MRRTIQTYSLIATFAAAAILPGCHEPAHRHHEPVDSMDSKLGVAARWLHESPAVSAAIDHIQIEPADQSPPRTTTSPEATELWQMSLQDAVSLGLENSEIIRTLVGGGVATSPGSFAGTSPIGAGQVRQGQLSIYDPAISEAAIQSALSAFDANWATNVFWTRIDQPPGVRFGGGIPIPNQRDQAEFRSTLSKLIATGGTAGIAFNTNYLFIPPFRTAGPDGIIGTPDDTTVRSPAQYTPNVEFSMRQPLLRGAGIDFNRAPIVVARLQSDQSLWDFKDAVINLVRSIEEAYWNLHAAHVALRSAEEVLPHAQEVVRIEQTRVEFEQTIPKDAAQAIYRLNELRQQRSQALADVLDREAILRNLLGLPPSDGKRIVPSEAPSRAPLAIDWLSTLSTALNHRPQVIRQRLAVRVRELEVLIAKNSLQPQLDVEALWRVNGLDSELDEAIGLLTDNQFTDWQIGVTFAVPIGFRQAAAAVHTAELRLDKERAQLVETVHQTSHTLSATVRQLDALFEQFRNAQDRIDAARIWMDGAREIYFEPPPGKDLTTALTEYLEALRLWAASVSDASNLLAQYNSNLAQLEQDKGTLLAAYNIQLHEDPCARVRRHAGAIVVPPQEPAPHP